MSYQIAYGNTLLELIKHVNNLLTQGWRPQGGVTTVTEDGKTLFVQAIVHD